jgi:sodium transport system ATP-binding protein
MIQAINLAKIFEDKKRGRKVGVAGVSFHAHGGEIYGLLGPNGAGKTTALRMLATILRPTSGTAVVAGHDVLEEPGLVRRNVGFLSGDMGLYHRITPRETLRFFGQLSGMDDSSIRRRTSELFEVFGIGEFGDSRVDKLSTGMKQKVAVARAVIHDPPVLILDEPTSGLDVPAAHVVEEYILNAKRAGKCVLLSTHAMEEAEFLCDRIAIINEGKIGAEGTMDELRRRTGKQRLREVFLALLNEAAA